jgi:hypothetical protein
LDFSVEVEGKKYYYAIKGVTLEDLNDEDIDQWGFDKDSHVGEMVIEHANKRVAMCAYTKMSEVLSDSAFEGHVFLSLCDEYGEEWHVCYFLGMCCVVKDNEAPSCGDYWHPSRFRRPSNGML